MLKNLFFSIAIFMLSQHLFAQNAKPISLFIKDTQGECYKEFYVPVQVKDFKNVSTLQFSLSYDATAFAWQGVKYVKLGTINAVTLAGNGKVSYAWQGNAANLNDNDTLFVIALQPIEKGGYSTDITFTNDPTPLSSTPNNISTTKGSIKIIDISAPIIKCPKTVFIDTVNIATAVVGITPFIKDTCDNNSAFTEKYVLTGATTGFGPGDANGKTFNVGTTNVIYTASDHAGNKAICPFQVIISDKTPDLFLYAQNTQVSCETDEIVIEIWAKNVKKLGSTDFSFAWDALAGTFKSIDLSTSPAIMELAISQFNNIGNAVGFSWIANPITSPNGVTLNNGKAVYLFSVKLKSSRKIGNNYQLTFPDVPTAKDASIITNFTPPNMVTQQAIGIIPTTSLLLIEDNKKPTVTCPKDVIIMETTGANSMVVNNLAPITLDNCGVNDILYTSTKENGTLLKNGFMNISGTAFPLGTNKVTYTVNDFGGNVSTCSFTVKINRLELIAQSDTLDCNGKKAKINIIVKNFNNIKRLKFDLNWANTTNLIYNTSTNLIESSNTTIKNTVDFNPNNGKYTGEVSSLSPNGTTLPDGTILATVILNVSNSTIGSIYDVTFSNDVADFAGPPVVLNLPKIIKNGKINILDKVGPVFTKGCGQDVVLLVKSGACDTTFSWTADVLKNIDVIDSCSTVTAVTQSITSPNVFSTGLTKVNYRAIDAYGNITNCGFNVLVKDAKAPNVPNSVTRTYYSKADSCAVFVSNLPKTNGLASDNCELDSVKVSHKNNTYFPIGTTPVTYTAYDKSGNSATYTYTVVVKDTISPKITGLQNNFLTIKDTLTCTVPAAWQAPVATDNCGQGLTLTSDIKLGDPLTAGKHIVKFKATDSSGNVVNKTILIVVLDTAPPIFQNPPKDLTLDAEVGKCGRTVNIFTPNAIDNCSGTSVSVTVNQSLSDIVANNFYEAGKTYKIVFEANDTSASSGPGFYVWRITIKPDNVPPTLVCPGTTVIASSSNSCGANVNTLPLPITLSDNCTAAPNIKLNTSNFIYGYKVNGSYSVTYTATDEAGNSATCAFALNVKDITKPTFVNKTPAIQVNAESGKCTAKVTWIEPTFTDNCSPDSIKLTKIPNIVSGSDFVVGTTKIIFIITDKAGNVNTDTLVIRVMDEEAPTPTKPCGDLITLVADKDACGATLLTNGLFIDNCGGQVTVKINNPLPNNFYPTGSASNITLVATDSQGNAINCNYVVKVADKQKPTHTACPSDLIFNLSKGKCDTIFTAFPKPIFQDKCDANLDVAFNAYPKPAANGAISETTTVYYFAKDDDGNADTCSYKIIVKGNNLPKVTCPSDVISIATAGACSKAVVWNAPIITKGCVNIKDTSVTFASGSSFNVGTTTVGYTVIDDNGKVDVCTFKVTVRDTVKPKFEGKACPKDTVLFAATDCTATYKLALPLVAKDDCDGTISAIDNATIPNGDIFKLGKTKMTFVATDKSGNSAVCKFTVEVKSNAKPTFVKCPTAPIQMYVNGQILNDDQQFIQNFTNLAACDGVNLVYNNPLATTTCSSIKVSSNVANPLSNSKFKIGTTPMSFEVVDTFGNKATCAFNIEILTIPTPNIIQKDTSICGTGVINLKATGTIAGATYKWSGPNNYTNTGANVSISIPTNLVGLYKVQQITSEGCNSKTDSVNISVIASPTGKDDKYEVVTGKTLTDKVNSNDNLQAGAAYSINLKSDVNAAAGKLTLKPDGTFTFDAKAGYIGIATFAYEICYTDCKKCSNALIVQIEVKPDISNCVVPNVITPNNDNLNDFLVIDCAVGKADNELTVFNRWGEQVFNAAPYDGVNSPWDATYKGEGLPDGTYFYVYKDSANAEAKKGYITIFR